MISYDMQDFGGLEEYAVNLAIALHQQGHSVSYLSCAWVSPQNQYARRLQENDIPLVEPPRWISNLASNWETKEKILKWMMVLLSPITFLSSLALLLLKRSSFRIVFTSAYNFFKGRIMNGLLGRDYRQSLGRYILSAWQRRWHADIFHIQGYTTTLLFAIEWAHGKKIPVVYEEHQTPDPQFNWWRGFEDTINLADRVIAVSEKSAQGLREICKVTRPIVVRAPLLADPYFTGWQREFGQAPNRPFMITTLARLYVTKGLTHLLDAAALVRAKYPHVEFRVYGEGELRDDLMSKAQALGFDGRKIFPGAFSSRSELTRIMEATDIFLLSSILEGQPLVIVEAMAYGCPIVTTNVGGIAELIRDGENGFLCPPADPHALAEKIIQLIEDPSLRRSLGLAARANYENSPFEPGMAAKNFIATYRGVLAEAGKGRVTETLPTVVEEQPS